VLGASRRAGEAGAGVAGLAIVAAVVLAGLSLLFGPISLVAAVALAWLGRVRRRRASRKHEGLRVLR
jgi:hypothetical protein